MEEKSLYDKGNKKKKSVAYSSQVNRTSQLDFYNRLRIAVQRDNLIIIELLQVCILMLTF